MLNQQTIEKLYAMRMRGMADAFTQQQEEPQAPNVASCRRQFRVAETSVMAPFKVAHFLGSRKLISFRKYPERQLYYVENVPSFPAKRPPPLKK
jgi:hypothetical protein